MPELLQHEVQVESMGGETLEVEVSAKQKLNLEKLLEAISYKRRCWILRPIQTEQLRAP